MIRQTGFTTKQMREAPNGALFVWCNESLFYPRRLARSIGRDDLQIVPASWLRFKNICGASRPVKLDHALIESQFSSEQIECCMELIRTGRLA